MPKNVTNDNANANDVLPVLGEVPVITFDWKKEEVPTVKNGM